MYWSIQSTTKCPCLTRKIRPKFWGSSSGSSMNAPERILETNIGGIGPKLKSFSSAPRLRVWIMLGAGVTEGMSSVGSNTLSDAWGGGNEELASATLPHVVLTWNIPCDTDKLPGADALDVVGCEGIESPNCSKWSGRGGVELATPPSAVWRPERNSGDWNATSQSLGPPDAPLVDGWDSPISLEFVAIV